MKYENPHSVAAHVPAIVNDERKACSSVHNSLQLPGHSAERTEDDRNLPEYDGIDIRQLLGNEQADRLLLSSALRMSCTPISLPNVLFANRSADPK